MLMKFYEFAKAKAKKNKQLPFIVVKAVCDLQAKETVKKILNLFGIHISQYVNTTEYFFFFYN